MSIKPQNGRRSYAKGGTVRGYENGGDVEPEPVMGRPERIYSPMKGYTFNENTGMYSNDEPGTWIHKK